MLQRNHNHNSIYSSEGRCKSAVLTAGPRGQALSRLQMAAPSARRIRGVNRENLDRRGRARALRF
jgi:hypothetical protein